MNWTRSMMTWVLVAIAVLVVGCGSAPTNAGPVYTPEEIAQIQRYTTEVSDLRDRLTEAVPPMIANEEWLDVETFIHGPLGELRTKMASLTRSLEPKLQSQSQQTARDVFGHLVKLDEAARGRASVKAIVNYNGAIEDLAEFLNQVPAEVRGTDEPSV